MSTHQASTLSLAKTINSMLYLVIFLLLLTKDVLGLLNCAAIHGSSSVAGLIAYGAARKQNNNILNLIFPGFVKLLTKVYGLFRGIVAGVLGFSHASTVSCHHRPTQRDSGIASNKLPDEIWIRIFKYAMTGTGGSIRLTCLTERSYNPNVAVGLLRVSRSIYHEARDFLYSQNDIIFDNFASELNLVNWPYGGMPRCVLMGCVGSIPQLPLFKSLRFDLGHNFCMTHGAIMTKAFEASLNRMKYIMRAATLVLQLRAYAFATPDDFATFAKVLAKKVKITCMLEIWGDVTYEQLHYKGMAQLMGLNENSETGWVYEETGIFVKRYSAL